MTQVSRRTFGKQTLLFSAFAALSLPGQAMAFLDKIEKKKFLYRDDIGYAMKSIFMTYDGTSKYLHKFNDVVGKTQLRRARSIISTENSTAHNELQSPDTPSHVRQRGFDLRTSVHPSFNETISALISHRRRAVT